MLLTAGLVLLLLLAALIIPQMRCALGVWRGTALGSLLVLVFGGGWGALQWSYHRERPVSEDQVASPPVTSQACFKCHESHCASWQRTFHRTMTREATPENVKADFDNAVHHYQGIASRMVRVRDRFYMETADLEAMQKIAQKGIPLEKAGPVPRRMYSVDRLVGSHWFQQMLHCDDEGRYLRLPLAYHIVEGRWVHVNGAFLAPTQDFWSKIAIWNESCVWCHNTRPNKNPQPIPGALPGYRTEVGELGIACEACHGSGERHIRAHQNPARRLAQHYSGEADPTIINPAKLSVVRSDEVCARCHGSPKPKPEVWDPNAQPEQFLAGRDLTRFYYLYWSEAELRRKGQGQQHSSSTQRERLGALDGSFWGDGTPLTTALEYQGMALSACYENGHGQMRCLSCHSMHQGETNHQMKDGMRTNEACYACHETYRSKLVQHTHHAADSPGSLCFNCHMPHQVYSLLATHRSHRIAVPRVRDSLGTGKPHACNLCHLDKSLGWTQEQLGKWYGTKPEPLSDDERNLASSLLHLMQSDARTRAVVAGAFSQPTAQQASGRDWPTELLMRTLEKERYEAVRYLAFRALRSLHGEAIENPRSGERGYDYQGSPAERAAQLRGLRLQLESAAKPGRSRYPYLPLTAGGRFADDVLDRLLRSRNDPDVFVNE
jgi:predicted CXXCH cytochrome family protein